MSDNRKYYYLKLKENYFDDDSIVLLESMQDGILYSYILLKLYLKSLKHGSRLELDENIPYTAQMIATLTRQQMGTVERAMKIYLQLGLVEVMTDGPGRDGSLAWKGNYAEKISSLLCLERAGGDKRRILHEKSLLSVGSPLRWGIWR